MYEAIPFWDLIMQLHRTYEVNYWALIDWVRGYGAYEGLIDWGHSQAIFVLAAAELPERQS